MHFDSGPKLEAMSETPGLHFSIRHSLALQLLKGGIALTTYANDLETHYTGLEGDTIRENHLKAITDAAMYSAMALKAEIHDVIYYGPGYHLSPTRFDADAYQVLGPLHTVKYKTLSTLQQYNAALHLLRKPAIDQANPIYQNAALLIELSDVFMAFKSTWGAAEDRRRLFERLQPFSLQHVPLRFGNPYLFPAASLGRWCVQTATAYINAFYSRLRLRSPLRPYADCLAS